MRLLADENCPRTLIRLLREAGHDVAWIREDSPGIPDREVLARALRERRVVATFDKGFGDLAFRSGLPALCGVLLFRLRGTNATAVADRAAEALESRDSWMGVFATVTDTEVRIRHLGHR
jgi:predicted nuclease of predicted toxin-antitoxin system